MSVTVLAYIDPGSGSILLQLLVGSIVGLGLFFRQSVARVFGVFRRGDRSTSNEPVGDSVGE